jgi:hypothetical protein
MAVAAGPDIVEDGLAIYLDAANERSYPGSGNAWYDLSGNGNNGTIVPRVKGFEFKSTTNQGILYFPDQDAGSVREYAYVTTPIPTGDLSYTVRCLFRTESTAGERHVFRTAGNFGCDISGGRLRYYTTSYLAETAYTGVNTFPINTWHDLVMVYDRANTIMRIYKNGEEISSKSHSTTYSLSTSTNRWFTRSDDYVGGISGDVGFVQFYTRVLTDAEIKQNYVAVKSRYGL